MNDPLKVLEEEHRVIEKVLKVLKYISEDVKEGVNPPVDELKKAAEFLRMFADKCHHGKEEDILFPVLESRGIPRLGGPIGVMLQEHEQGRNLVKKMLQAIESIEKGDKSGYMVFSENALYYVELLEAHISKEDNVLYPIGRNVLNEEDAEKLLESFEKIEEERMGPGVHEKYHKIAEELSLKYR
jgi:hemerythrin-like domain-containing protein